ncbi:MAG: alpha-ketoacid dehydrogenase subunit beta [Nitrososphaeria archaeon]|jgi:pyruvate dehydrogenase E1 component beta subunit
MREITYAEALNEALRIEMSRNERVIVLGEDVGVFGGIFGVTKGLLEEFGPDRVVSTPISEDGFTGAALGLSLAGYKPVVEIMYMDFILLALNQIINHAAKVRFISGGKLEAPMVIRVMMNYGPRYTGPQHTQDFAAFLAHIPGLKVVAPATPYDAKGLLESAIRYERDPVIFLEHSVLYRTRGPVPEEEYFIPIGTSDVKVNGEDVTIVGYSYATWLAMSAAKRLKEEGISAEVLDLRTLYPLDRKAIITSVEKTGRLVVVAGDVRSYGVGAEIVSTVAEEALHSLKVPPVRIAVPDLPVPFSPPLVDHVVPTEDMIVSAVKNIVKNI